MAGAVIGALRVNLGMDSAQFTRGLKGAETGLQRFGQMARTGLIALSAAAAASATALGFAVRSTIDYADATAKTADRIGWHIEELQRLRHAGELTGVSQNNLDLAMQRFSRRVGEAAQGGGELRATLEQYGIAITDAEGRTRSQVDILGDLADVIAGASSEQEQLRIAFKAFDSEGAALVNTLRGGSGALHDMMNEADQLGLVISTNTARAAERFNDNLTRIQGIFQGIIRSITAALLPSLEYLSDAFFNATANGEQMRNMAANLAIVFKALVTTAVVAGEAIKAVGYSVSTLMRSVALAQGGAFGMAFQTLQYGFQDVATSAADATAFVEGLWAAVAGGASEGGETAGEGGESSPFTPIISGAGQAAEAIDLIGDSVDGIADKTQSFAEMAAGAFSGIGSELARAFMTGGNVAKNALEVIIGKFAQLGEQLLDMATNQLISNLLGSLLGGGSLFGVGSGGGLGFGTTRSTPLGFGAYSSFAGGGYTGDGSRSGGIDGMGGFPAILHPQETVIDHARGNGGSALVRIELGPGLEARMLQQSATQTVQIVNARVPNMIKQGAPAAVAQRQRNKY